MQSFQRIMLTFLVASSASMVTIGHDCWGEKWKAKRVSRWRGRCSSTRSWGGRKQPPQRGPFKCAEELGFCAVELVGEANTLGVGWTQV